MLGCKTQASGAHRLVALFCMATLSGLLVDAQGTPKKPVMPKAMSVEKLKDTMKIEGMYDGKMKQLELDSPDNGTVVIDMQADSILKNVIVNLTGSHGFKIHGSATLENVWTIQSEEDKDGIIVEHSAANGTIKFMGGGAKGAMDHYINVKEPLTLDMENYLIDGFGEKALRIRGGGSNVTIKDSYIVPYEEFDWDGVEVPRYGVWTDEGGNDTVTFMNTYIEEVDGVWTCTIPGQCTEDGTDSEPGPVGEPYNHLAEEKANATMPEATMPEANMPEADMPSDGSSPPSTSSRGVAGSETANAFSTLPLYVVPFAALAALVVA